MFVAGLLISVVMVLRSSVGGDQLDLLARGWRWAAQGDLVPYGNPLSNGGKEPGALTSIVVGLPLFVRMDHRAPVALIWLTHLLAYLLLDRVVREGTSAPGRTLFCLFYWLNPWQLFFAGMLWNPSYLFLIGAAHLWSCWSQREGPRFWPSFVHGLALVCALQLHPSAVILILASALLWWRGYVRMHWAALLLGGALASAPLLPWWFAVRADPGLLPGGKGFPFRNLVLVLPTLRGVFYWLRYGSFMVMGRMTTPDFTSALGVTADAVLAPIVDWTLATVGVIGFAVTAWVTLLFAWRKAQRRRVRRGGFLRSLGRVRSGPRSRRTWLWGYAAWTGTAALFSFAASPTTIMGWQILIALHAAVLPIVFGCEALLRTARWRRFAVGVPAYAAVSSLLLLSMAFASPDYRCKGRRGVNIPLLADHPMFRDLQIDARCPFPVDPADGWWPDALPRPAGAPPAEQPVANDPRQ